MFRQLLVIVSLSWATLVVSNPSDALAIEAETHGIERENHIDHLLQSANKAIEQGHLLAPAGRDAVGFFRSVLAEQPQNALALAGMSRVQAMLLERAWIAANDMDYELAMSWVDEADTLLEDQASVEAARLNLISMRQSQVDDIEQEIQQRLSAGEFNRAEIYLIDLVALGVERERVLQLRQQIEQARVYGEFQPGQVVRDLIHGTSDFAPAVVVIPVGSFMMGALESDDEASDDQRPRHRVNMSNGIAMGLTELSIAEFRQFTEATRYLTRAELDGNSMVYDEGTGRLVKREGINWRHDFTGRTASEQLPVIHVSWDDAMAYTAWLSEATGQTYRLPTEAEFEYVQRAGSATAYWWGDGSPASAVDNLTGDGDASPRNRNWSVAFADYADGYWGPAPVGALQPNPFGLFDVAGNVSEWVMDCWHDSYVRAPDDGSAWTNPGCERRVIRGGYWASAPAQVRSEARLYAESELRGPRVGFRVIREL